MVFLEGMVSEGYCRSTEPFFSRLIPFLLIFFFSSCSPFLASWILLLVIFSSTL